VSSDEPPGSKPSTPDDAGEELEFSIARSNALVPMLLLFGLTVLAIVLVVVRSGTVDLPAGAPATHAFGPADFPNIVVRDDAVTALKAANGAPTLFPVPPPPFSDGIFPCSSCHADLEPNPERRELTMHDDIVLKHDEEHRWCLDCHDLKDRDQLHLANGAPVPFTESYRLCGQCHGTQFRDWRNGVHGKRTGYWNGAKRYLLCVNCHNPHHPRFAPLKPLPPPVRPQLLAVGAHPRAGDVAKEEHADARRPD
jgi:hypothetical protein